MSNDRIGRALDQTGNDLVGWVRRLEDDRGIEQPNGDGEAAQTAAICDSLADNLVSISTLDWAGELVADLRRIEAWLRGLTERVVPGWYAGGCRRPVGFDEDGAAVRCGADTFVVPGLTWVTCAECGTTTYARDHLEVILDEARGWVAPPKRIAEVVVALMDGHTSVEDLRKRIAIWGARDRISTVRANDYAVKQHRLGEVLDQLAG